MSTGEIRQVHNLANIVLYFDCYKLPDPPVVSVSLGSSVGASSLREGDSVTLTCDARAFPEAERVTWYHGVSWE